MAENLDDGVFWLPPQFLADDDMFVDKKNNTAFNLKNDDDAIAASKTLFPSEFPYGYFVPSDLGSPVESLVGSSETESDEEEHMVELTRRMARSTLQVDFPSEKSTGLYVSGSPQSTLCAFGSGCGCRKGSSQGSPNGACQLNSQRATWDLLHAAAGDLERMRLSEGRYGLGHQHSELLGPQRKPSSPVTLPVKSSNPEVGFYSQHSLSHQQLQIAQFQMLREQQMAKQQNSAWGVQQTKLCGGGYQQRRSSNQIAPNRGRNSDVGGGRNNNNRPLGSSPSAWPPLQHAKQQSQQQQYGSGMRAVFLGNPSGKRECVGTGVFLPRRVDSPAESRKKPACSTVLVPARVAQALNLNLDNTVRGHPQQLHRFNGSSKMENAATVPTPGLRSNYDPSQQKSSLRAQPAMNHEIRLPQEWTY